MGKVKVVECVGEVMREVHFDDFVDFLRWEVREESEPTQVVKLDDGWVSWFGGKDLPVTEDTSVEAKLRSGEIVKEEAGYLDWSFGYNIEEHGREAKNL